MATLAEIVATRRAPKPDAPQVQCDLPPWMQPLSTEARDAVRRNVDQAPKLTDRQRERLRLLFQAPTNGGPKERERSEPPR